MKLLRQYFNFYLSRDKQYVQAIYNITGIIPVNLELYKQAFRHRSLYPEVHRNNERLELLGDAIFDAIIADYLFHKYPKKEEGFLTELKAKVISRRQLNQLARKMGLDSLVQANINSDVANKDSLLGNAFEALVAAIYLDRGYKKAEAVIIKRVLQPFLDMDALKQTEFNFKSRLLEFCQKNNRILSFRLVRERIVENRKYYHCAVHIDDEPMGEGEGFSKKAAEQMAARLVLDEITKSGYR